MAHRGVQIINIQGLEQNPPTWTPLVLLKKLALQGLFYGPYNAVSFM
jgi:hypothetical protein